MTPAPAHSTEALWCELWTSLATLLRSYTAAHGLDHNLQAMVELTEGRIIVRHRENRLTLDRSGAQITWTRENRTWGTLEFTDHGRLLGSNGEQELDMAAEAWARDLMQKQIPDETRSQMQDQNRALPR